MVPAQARRFKRYSYNFVECMLYEVITPFVTACCGMEYMSAAGAHHDIDRFGAAVPRFSPRQADVSYNFV